MGKLIVISGASGVGKGTVMRAMMEKRKDLFFSVSATTRPPRPGEVDGKDYYFVTRQDFEELIRRGEMLEYDEHAKNYYGTPPVPGRAEAKTGPRPAGHRAQRRPECQKQLPGGSADLHYAPQL